MNCEDVMKFSFAYLDGEFDARDRTEFETHLAMCGHCREAVSHDANFRDSVRKHLVVPTCDPEMRARVQQRLAAARRKARLSRTLTVPMALAASVAVAFVSWQGLVAAGGDGAVDAQPPAVSLAAVPAAVRPVGAIADPGAGVEHAVRAAITPQPAAVVAARASKGAAAAVGGAAAAESAAASGGLRLVAAQEALAADRSGGAGIGSVAQAADESTAPAVWPLPDVRGAAGLRSLVKTHASPLPDEVQGGIAKVQAYLAARMAGVGAAPIGEGTGVHLRGARFSQIAGHPVVVYRYAAFGKALTAIRFLQPKGQAPFDEPRAMTAPGHPGGQIYRTLDDHLAGYTVVHVLEHGVRFALVSELEVEAMKALLQPDVK